MFLVSIMASNFYCMAIATELSSLTGPPSAADWVAACVAAASETSVKATAAVVAAATDSIITTAADSIITTAANTSSRNATNVDIAAPLAAAAEKNDDNAITTLKRTSVISSAAKISLDKRQCDNQPDERHERGR